MPPQASAAPPPWADALLRLLLSSRDREAVSGDLLEQYRESIRPRLGHRGAQCWFVRQVLAVLRRSSWLPATLIACTLSARHVADVVAPAADAYELLWRAEVTSYALCGLFAFTSVWVVWRTERITAGVIVAVSSAVAGGVLSTATVVWLLLIHPQASAGFARVGGLHEALYGVPALVAVLAALFGLLGGLWTKWVSLVGMRRLPGNVS